MRLHVDVRDDGDGWTRLAVSGELDLHTRATFRRSVEHRLAQQRTRVVVDLRLLTFSDSSGLGVLVAALKQARAAGGELELDHVPPHLAQVLAYTGLDRVLVVRSRTERLVAS